MSDKDLIARARDGDRVAFEALLREHYDAMFRVALRWSGNRHDAEDITQEACIKLARHIGSFRSESAFSSWLYRLVVNTGKDMVRRRPKPVADPEVSVAPSGEDQVHARQVLALVDALPANERLALVLVHGEGLRHRDAAAIMDCKESTVSWYIHEARKKLGAHGAKAGQHG
jgi:RNA polymerase sigma-70 factor (ECF subfamily)